MSEQEVPPVFSEERPRSVLAEVLNRRRILLVVGVLVVELALFAVGLLTPLSNSAQQSLANETSSQFSGFRSASPEQLVVFIFSHNLSIALAEMVPLLGAFLFVLSAYSTGLAAQAIVASQGLPGQFGAILLAFPYSLVELSAYAIAVGAGIMLLVSWRRKRLRRELKVFFFEVVVVAAVLVVAATMETATEFSPLLGFALWLPTGLVLAGIIVLSWRKQM
jgi:uncharacterized membrane protein SpoIIM required for sporulation